MKRKRNAFTLVELLVVVLIVLITTVIALAYIVPAMEQSQVDAAARALQAALSGARDAAIRANAPRGIRLLPDPLLTDPSFANATLTMPAGNNVLAYNRIIPIEPAPDYTEGRVSIGPQIPVGYTDAVGFPTDYPDGRGGQYPFPDSSLTPAVLMIEQSPFLGGYIDAPSVGTFVPNPQTNWYWNVRVGDKIRINDSGPYYTIVGPCTVNPHHPSYLGQNAELFVNVGPPGTRPPLRRYYYRDRTAAQPSTSFFPEFLFLVNGIDDDKDGFVDEGFNGMDDNIVGGVVTPNGLVDEVASASGSEWETETWLGAAAALNTRDITGVSTYSPSGAWKGAHFGSPTIDKPYVIKRRPIPSPGNRETVIPGPIVIDATTGLPVVWKTDGTSTIQAQERSRLPIDPNNLTVDIMVNADGQIIPQTIYSSPAAFNEPFFHFWLTERTDVHPARGDGVFPQLPMSADSGYTGADALKGNRRLVTIFTKSGLVTTGLIENFDTTTNQANGGPLAPFIDAQRGVSDVKQSE